MLAGAHIAGFLGLLLFLFGFTVIVRQAHTRAAFPAPVLLGLEECGCDLQQILSILFMDF